MSAHTSAASIAEAGITSRMWVGSRYADEAAKLGASRIAPTGGEVEERKRFRDLHSEISKLVGRVTHLVNDKWRDTDPAPPREAPFSLVT